MAYDRQETGLKLLRFLSRISPVFPSIFDNCAKSDQEEYFPMSYNVTMSLNPRMI
jgi:hypothetical protein